MSEAIAVQETEIEPEVLSVEDTLYPDTKSEDESDEAAKDEEAKEEPAKDEESKEGDKEAEESDKDETEEKSEDDKEETDYKLELKEKSLLDKSAAEDIESFAKDNNLSKEQAQEILSKQEEAVNQWWNKEQMKHEERVDQWRKDVESDPIMGGDNLEKVAGEARSVVERFASSDFKEMLKTSGYGNHPELVRFLSAIGKEMSNDTLVIPRANEAQTVPMHDLFYKDKNN